MNATAAVAIACQLSVSTEKIAEGLASFNGVDRRFQLRGKVNGIAVVDDYGHHPTEISATLAAARECGYRKIHVLFQPHRYTRTRDLLEEFSTAFTLADTVTIPAHLRRQRRTHPPALLPNCSSQICTALKLAMPPTSPAPSHKLQRQPTQATSY